MDVYKKMLLLILIKELFGNDVEDKCFWVKILESVFENGYLEFGKMEVVF